MEKNELLNSLDDMAYLMPCPGHDTVISNDDIVNLKIDLGLYQDVSQFIMAIK
jgi:hypothetical protein